MHKFKLAFLLPLILVSSAFAGPTLGSLEKELKALFEEVKPSIVTVKYRASDFGKDFGEFLGKKLVTTGVIIDNDGHILTTKNFYSDPKDIEVELSNNETRKAEFIGWDAQSKIAVIKIEGDDLTPAKIGNSEEMEAGDWALIVGNSFGISHSITLGTISGRREDEDFIQVSANVSPGSSGAGVFNTDKKLIGVVAATLSRNFYISPNELSIGIELSKGVFSTSDGSTLVIPIERAMSIAKDIIEKGSREPGWLGVYINDLSEELKGVAKIDEGAVVTEVVEDSPAYKAGIKKWDIIVEFDNKPVKDAKSLIDLIRKTKPGTKVKIKILREGKEKELSAEIGKRKDSPFNLYYYRYLPKFPEFYFPPLPHKEIKKDLEDTLKKYKELKIKKETKNYI